MTNFVSRLVQIFNSRKNLIVLILLSGLITGFLLLLYKPALAYMPSNGDDLVILSKAAQISNPFQYFASDWGLGNYAYRPLHAISIWLMYRMVGVWAFPNQVINLGLHILNVLLVFILLYRQKIPIVIAALISVCIGTSLYSVSPATWVSDRPTLMVAVLLNIALLFIFRSKELSRGKTVFVYACLFLLACLSKESGLIVPISVGVIAFLLKKPERIWIIGSAAVVTAGYLLFRSVIFHGQAFSYSESGYLFGWVSYPDNARFPFLIQVLVYTDNILKNIGANVLLIFGPEGGFLSWADARVRIVMIISIFLVFGVTYARRKNGAFGKAALIIVIVNAIIHFQLFRYRALYIGFETIMLFIGASYANSSWVKQKASLLLISFLLVLSVGSNVYYVQDHLLNQSFKRSREMNRYELTNVIAERGSQLSPDILHQVLDQYKNK